MGQKLGIALGIILVIVMPICVAYSAFANLRMEEAYCEVNGNFGKVEIKDINVPDLFIELTSINSFGNYSLLSLPTDRILEIAIYQTNNVIKDYVDYNTLQNNTFEYDNVTLYINGHYELYGVIGEGEIGGALLVWIILFMFGALLTMFMEIIISDLYTDFKKNLKYKKAERELQRTKEEKEHKKRKMKAESLKG